jgi:hypothetical protein
VGRGRTWIRIRVNGCHGREAPLAAGKATAERGDVRPENVGIEPLRDLYDPRHTYATFALRAGVPCSLCPGSWARAMIDLHYGHVAVDSHEHAVLFLDALALERAVDAGWTRARKPATPTASHRAFVAV